MIIRTKTELTCQSVAYLCDLLARFKTGDENLVHPTEAAAVGALMKLSPQPWDCPVCTTQEAIEFLLDSKDLFQLTCAPCGHEGEKVKNAKD